MKISVQYSTMIVNSLEESVAFYRDVLGFSEGYHVKLPVGAITIMNSPGGASVELIEAPQFPTGLYSVGTDVDDLDETLDILKTNRISALLSQQAVLHIMREAPEIVRCFGADDPQCGMERMKFYVTGLFALVLSWHDRDFAESIDEMSAMLMQLMTSPPVKEPLNM